MDTASNKIFSGAGGKSGCVGINAVLRFFRIDGYIDESLPLDAQLRHAEELPLLTRRVNLDPAWNRTASLPVLAETADGGWITVIPKMNGKCFAVDNGRRKKITDNLKENFTGNAVCFYLKQDGGSMNEKSLISFFMHTISAKEVLFLMINSAAVILAGMLLPWINSFIFSRVIPSGHYDDIYPAAALLFSAVTLSAGISLLQRLLFTNVMLRVGGCTQSLLFSRLLSLRPDFFRRESSGSLSRNIMEFSDMTRIFSARSLSACLNTLLSMLYLIQMFAYAPGLSGWIVLFTLLMVGMMLAEGLLNMRWNQRYQTSLSSMSGFCYEMFSGMEQIKLNGAESRILHRFGDYFADVLKREEPPFFLKYADVFYKLLMLTSVGVIFFMGARLSVPDYIAFYTAYGAYTAALFGLSGSVASVTSFRVLYARISRVLAEKGEMSENRKFRPDNINGDIVISNLFFRYSESEPYVINGLSLNVKQGESVGIIGTSGCGKSTLIRLLLGFENPEKGSISIDGYDLRELDLRSLRRRTGSVLQNAGLLPGDIFTNITITKPDASSEEVEYAIRAAGLSDDIDAMPLGLHTPVNPEIPNLSGGQKQRILIARAILARPSVIIFDEATSALDNIAQSKVTESINSLPCTKIIIAHRLSTIMGCDRILVMDKGQFVQDGTFEELENEGGLFARFIKHQTV